MIVQIESVRDLDKVFKSALGSTVPSGEDSPGALIWAIGSIVDPNATLLDVLRNHTDALEHRFYTFAWVCMQDVLLEILSRSKLSFTTTETNRRGIYLAVVSGTLKCWRDTLILDWQSYDARAIMNKLLIQFDKLGLGQVFGNYSRIQQKDGTLLLEKK